MKIPEIGDVFKINNVECVVEQVHYHPSENYQGQGDGGCYSQSREYWKVSGRELNSDGSYNKNGSVRQITLFKEDSLTIVRKMQMSFA